MPTVYYGYGTFISWSLKKIAFADFEKNSPQVETFFFFGKPHLIEKGHSLQGTFSIPMYFTRCKKPRPSEKSTFEHFPDLGSSWKLMHRFQQNFLRIETVLTRKWIFWDFWTHQHVGADLNFRPPKNDRFFGLNPPPPNPLFFEFFDKSPPQKSGCRLPKHFLYDIWIHWG